MLLHLDTDFTLNQCRATTEASPPPPLPPLTRPLFEPLTPAVPTVVCVIFFFLFMRRRRGSLLKIVARLGRPVQWERLAEGGSGTR